MDKEELYKRQEESCKRYLNEFVYPSLTRVYDGRIGVDVRSKLGAAEPYLIYWAESVNPKNRYPYHLTQQEVNKLSEKEGCAYVYGRTLWGPWCELCCRFYRVVSIVIMRGSELSECERYMHEILEGGNSHV